VSEYATFVVQFMDAMGIERGVVAGHSMGGAIALSAALDKPGRVAGLVLVGTGARLRVLPTILEGTLTDWPATAQLVCQYAYSSKAPAALVQLGQRQMLAVPGETVHDDFAACNDFDVTNRLGEIRCPTLVLCGTEDNLTPPKYSAFLAEQIHGARLRLIEKAGHMVMIEKEREVAEAISEWLRQCLS
jgi:pimeloyl-ACP methyl ester carboxylesterase